MLTIDAHLSLTFGQLLAIAATYSGVGLAWRDCFRAARSSRIGAVRLVRLANDEPQPKRLER